jgi:TonB family protein
MSGLLDLIAGTSLILLVALTAAALLARHSAASRHLLLGAGLAATLLIGPLSWLSPPLFSVASAPPAGPDPIAPIEALEATASAPVADSTWWMQPALLVAVWIAGSTARMLWLAVLLLRLSRQTRRGQEPSAAWTDLLPPAAAAMGVTRRVAVKATDMDLAPATWGWPRPVILVPTADWPAIRVRVALMHELAHVRRLDWIVQLVGEAACAIHWFNPLVWIARRRLGRESERACDDLVLASGIGAGSYAGELTAIARLHAGRSQPAAAVPMARPSSLERRIVAMLDPTIDRRPLTRRTKAACGMLVLAAMLPAASLRVVAQDPAQSFTVQVFDPSGAVLPGVAIELEDAQKATRSATTEGSGVAVFESVPPGEYRVNASVAGFRTLRAAIVVEGTRDRQRSITLQVGELTETVTVRERRPPPGATPASRAVVEPLRVGGNIRAPRKLKHSNPVYPASMRDAGLEGTVPMEALIGRDGTVTSVNILSADVHPEFARAAADAVSQWLFSPTLLNGDAVEVRMAVSVRFSLQD